MCSIYYIHLLLVLYSPDEEEEKVDMKTAVAQVIMGVSVVVFFVWYITTKTDYWWIALLFVAVVVILATLTYRKLARDREEN